MFIPALTIRQPFAGLIMTGHKRWETRSWFIKREPPFCLLIHAASGRLPAPDLMEPPQDLPKVHQHKSCILGIVLIDTMTKTQNIPTSPFERTVGDFRPGRYAFHVQRAWPFPKPIPCRGNMGIWLPPHHVRPSIIRALETSYARFYLPELPIDPYLTFTTTLTPAPLNAWENGPGF